MATFAVLSTQPTIQVVSPTEVLETVTANVQTGPSGVQAALWLPKTAIESGQASAIVSAFAEGVEGIMASGKVSSGRAAQSFDDSGLLQQTVAFTVSYTPPGSVTGALETDIEIPTPLLSGVSAFGVSGGQQLAQQVIDAAHANLVALANGKPGEPLPPLPAVLFPTQVSATAITTGGSGGTTGGGGSTGGGGGTNLPPDFSLILNPSTTIIAVLDTNEAALSLACPAQNGDTEEITLSASGLPTGMTAKFGSATIKAGGATTLTVTAVGVKDGSYPVTITAKGALNTHTETLTVQVNSKTF